MSGTAVLDTVDARPATRPPPLRDAVLAGAFFGGQAAATAERLATFIHGSTTAAANFRAWFGDDHAALLVARAGGLRDAIDRDIARIDTLIGEQLDAVLHADRVRQLERRWRGLHWLVAGMESGRRIKLRLLPIAWAEICRDLERAAEFDQSQLFRLIYENEFGMPGGEPFGLLLIDHEVRHQPARGAPTDDVGALGRLASVAAAAFAPTVLAAHPSLLEVDGFAELDTVQDIAAPMRDAHHARWRDLGSRPDIRFLAVTLPRLLARPPWTDDPGRQDGFRYREYAPDAASRVWMSASYAFAACVVRAYTEHNWPADVRGVETDRVGGGLVTGLPDEPFESGSGEAWRRVAIEVRLTDRQERALVDVGLMPVSALPYGPDMVFGTTRSLQVPLRHQGRTAAAADANARLSAQINAMLCASRFAHNLKVMGRDMVGAYTTADAMQRRLQDWLQGYVNTNTSSGPDTRARFPLLAGNVEVREHEGRPGSYRCTIHLQPHHQLDGVASTFSLVTELTAPGR